MSRPENGNRPGRVTPKKSPHPNLQLASPPSPTSASTPEFVMAEAAIAEADRLVRELRQRHDGLDYLPALASVNGLHAIAEGLAAYLTQQWNEQCSPGSDDDDLTAFATGGVYL